MIMTPFDYVLLLDDIVTDRGVVTAPSLEAAEAHLRAFILPASIYTNYIIKPQDGAGKGV